MGSPDDEPGREAEEGPQRPVTISGGFWIGTFEVTQRQYERLMGSTPSHFKDSGPDSPVERILWSEAASLCGRLQKLLPPDLRNRTVRLPTEAEWEYACRAGTTTAMNNGTAPTAEPGFCTNVAEVAWYRGNSGNTTQPVGQKKPNAWGLHDMHGNVMEWCADRYGPYDSGPTADPEGVAVGSTRVSRGGSWSSDAAQCRSAFRRRGDPEFRDSRVGFRIVIR
jgi:formylglycine-generating enzyme required for sulfatase activity